MRGNPPNIRRLAWGACLGIAALACIAWSFTPTIQSAPFLRIGLFLASGIAMLGLVFFFPETTDRSARRLIVVAAIFLRLCLWPAPVSDDVNRYIWEGELVRDGGNPYSAPADDPRWEGRRDAWWQAMNHRDVPTAYPPGIQWIMAAATTVHPSTGVFKILALAGDLIVLILLLGMLRARAAPLRWAGFYAFNPVVLIAFAAEAHFDSLMTAAMLMAILAGMKQRATVWLWLGIAIQIKLVCVILIPLFFTRRLLPSIWILLGVLVLPTLPFYSGFPEWWQHARQFQDPGSFNSPLQSAFAVIGLAPKIARPAGILIFALSAAAIFIIARRREMPVAETSFCLLGALLACSPVVHFWYLTWLLPLVALRPSFAWVTLSITLSAYFIAWWTEAHAGWWGYGHVVTALIWLPWFLTGIAQNRSLPSRLRARISGPDPFRISIVLPVLNAAAEAETFISRLGTEARIVVVDDGSGVNLNLPGVRSISAPRGRGNQIAAGIAATDTPWILIAHADCTPPPGWQDHLRMAIERQPDASLLVFGQRFDWQGPGTLLIEALNEMRTVFGGVAFGDQTMVIRRSALEAAGGFPAQPLMEDVETSLRLASRGRVVYLGREWTVSARKWRRGFGPRFLLVFRLVAAYQLARLKSPAHAAAVSERMYRIYYPEYSAPSGVPPA